MVEIEYEGIPCPVPHCQGFLKEADSNAAADEVVCEYGHIVRAKSAKPNAYGLSYPPPGVEIPAAGVVHSRKAPPPSD
jgi:hypothetical protein